MHRVAAVAGGDRRRPRTDRGRRVGHRTARRRARPRQRARTAAKAPRIARAEADHPVGVLAAPASVSVTVAVHVETCPTPTLAGEQLTLVEVERAVTVTVVLPLLGCVGRIAAVPGGDRGRPRTDGAGRVGHRTAGRPAAPDSVHGLPLSLPDPLVRLKNTFPVGVLAPLPAVSDTTAVHVVDCPTATLFGEQLTLVEVERASTVTCWLSLLAIVERVAAVAGGDRGPRTRPRWACRSPNSWPTRPTRSACTDCRRSRPRGLSRS